ncbi:uncharacterized protein PV09_03748 [Verruconis gallopava]|uniref:NAD(P)-binding protein n=1 Tax=Verruconis gallopava TaxID=253628 RepID=A0A0D2B1J3_9PEZI|nr:uncharacterized protein PV09_03748 [Verruconis gallopava]KIW05204.1 hypothetical protein PV09_03748 [Verruconis gallopava]
MSLYWYTPTPKEHLNSGDQKRVSPNNMANRVFTVQPSELKNIKNKVVVITGGASGIGLATGKLLISLDPSNKIGIIDRSPPPPSFASASNAHRILYQKCEITDWKSQRAAFANIARHYGRIDAVYANAGIAEYGDQFFDETMDASGQLAEPDRRVLKIDMDAAADTVRLAIHHLRKNPEGGSIVITASLAGYLASAGAGLYSAAKHGVVGLMRALKQDTKKFNIAISVVAPAITKTPILVGNREAEMNIQSGVSTEDAINQWSEKMSKVGVPINTAEGIALAVCHLIDGGMQRNGAGYLVQADKIWDFEAGLAKSREIWMSKEMLDLFRGGRSAPLFTRVDDPKAKM